MRNYIRNKIRSYVSGIAKQCVNDALTEDRWSQVADHLGERFTAVDIAGCVSPRDIAQYVDVAKIVAEIKDYCVEFLDASDVAENFSACEIASEIDLSEVASEVDVSDLADNLDYRRLALHLLHYVKGGA